MKKILFNILSVGFFTISLLGCIENPIIEPGVRGASVPVFEGNATIEGDARANSVTVSANIAKENGFKITERGFYYGTNSWPTLENGGQEIPDTSGTGIGSYTITIEGLINDTTYYILPYAKNEKGTGYSEQATPARTTPGVGKVNTIEPYDELASTFIAGIEIESEGEGEINAKGIYLYTNIDSTAIDTITDILHSEGQKYFYHITGLNPSTMYYVKAFAANNYGPFSGGVIYSITTKDGKPRFSDIEVIETGYTDHS